MEVRSHPPYTRHTIDRGNAQLGLHWYPPPADAPTPAPAVVLWPAMGVPAGYYRPFASALQQAGLAVAVADLRGTGDSTPRASARTRFGYTELVDDVGAVLDTLAPRLTGRRTILAGHSLGGQACLLHLARRPDPRVSGLVLVAVGLPWWRVYRGLAAPWVFAFTQTLGLTSAVLRHWPGWGFGGRQPRGVIRDWAYTARTGRFPPLGGVSDWQSALAHLRTPVLAVSLARDGYTPPATVDHLVRAVPSAPVHRVHADSDADHFRWAREPAPVAEPVVRFVRGD